VRSPSVADVFRLVADDGRDTRFEIFGRFDWSVRHRCSFLSANEGRACETGITASQTASVCSMRAFPPFLKSGN
jgi:hypothetical protein